MNRISLFILIVVSAFSVIQISFASTLRVVDKNLQPVKNAVVSIPSGADASAEPLPIAVMDQVNRQFSPQVLVIKKGQQVSFPNSDEIRHHVYSFSAIKPFEIRLYKGVGGDPIQFDKSGIGVLGCNIHDNMVGYIYVAENEVAKVSDEQGIVTFDVSLPESVMLWHSDLPGGSSKRVEALVAQDNGIAQVVLDIEIAPNQPERRTFKSRKFGQREQ